MGIKTRRFQWLRNRWLEAILLVGLAAVMVWFARTAVGFFPKPVPTPTPVVKVRDFSGESAMSFLEDQLALGPRPTGSENGKKTGDYILTRLREFGWETEVQEFTYRGIAGRNIIARAGTGPVVILGAHYDTRPKA